MKISQPHASIVKEYISPKNEAQIYDREILIKYLKEVLNDHR